MLLSTITANSFWEDLLINKTKINLTHEAVSFFSIFKKSKKSLLLKTKEINALQICKYHVNSNNKKAIVTQPDLVFLLKNSEYNLNSFTSIQFTDEEIVLLANKINEYLKKDIIE